MEKKYWCIPKVDAKFVAAMNDVLGVLERPYDPAEPVVCVDEKPKQLLADIRAPLKLAPGHGRRVDSEYKRKGTRNIFVGVEPKGGRHFSRVTPRKKTQDFGDYHAGVVKRYPEARKVLVILDNFSTHKPGCLAKVMGAKYNALAKVEFHFTPPHGSWLNPAEVEISALSRQCLNRRIGDGDTLVREVAAWEGDRNQEGIKINWMFTREKARKVFKLENEPN